VAGTPETDHFGEFWGAGRCAGEILFRVTTVGKWSRISSAFDKEPWRCKFRGRVWGGSRQDRQPHISLELLTGPFISHHGPLARRILVTLSNWSSWGASRRKSLTGIMADRDRKLHCKVN